MRKATIRFIITGVEIKVHATTNHPDSHYGLAVWVDDDDNAYFEVDTFSPFYEVIEEEDDD